MGNRIGTSEMKPALEIWVDVDSVLVKIRLAGVLDGQTGRNVYSVVEGLLKEGYVDFAMQVDIDPLGAAGFAALVDVQQLVKSAGGSVRLTASRHALLSTTLLAAPDRQFTIPGLFATAPTP